MKTKEVLVLVGEQIGEILIGLAGGLIAGSVTKDCNKIEKVLLFAGSTIGAWAIGRTWGKEMIGLANKYLDTDIDVD